MLRSRDGWPRVAEEVALPDQLRLGVTVQRVRGGTRRPDERNPLSQGPRAGSRRSGVSWCDFGAVGSVVVPAGVVAIDGEVAVMFGRLWRGQVGPPLNGLVGPARAQASR